MRTATRTLSIVLTLAASVGMGLLFAWLTERNVPGAFLRTFLLCFTYAATNGVSGALLLPCFVPRLRRLSALTQWLCILLLVVLMTAAACLATVGLFTWLGELPREELWTRWLRDLRVSVIISTVLGIAATLYEKVRERLVQATAALREQELKSERALKLASQAQLAALAARIHPHFLFNTLNSIAMLTRTEPRSAERMIEQLGHLLRVSLESEQRPLVPLEQELKLVEDYLQIERGRFGARLRFEMQHSGSLQGWSVPPLAVQTLVENSVKHAAMQREEGASIRVRVVAAQEVLRIEVSDDGPGFGPEHVRPGHGLDGVRARLAALFGDEGRLEILPLGHGATQVALVIPAARGRAAA